MVFDQEQHDRQADFTVHVDPTDGWIYLDGVRMTQRDAVDLAAALVQGVQRSIDRYQMDEPHYYDTVQILTVGVGARQSLDGSDEGVRMKAVGEWCLGML